MEVRQLLKGSQKNTQPSEKVEDDSCSSRNVGLGTEKTSRALNMREILQLAGMGTLVFSHFSIFLNYDVVLSSCSYFVRNMGFLGLLQLDKLPKAGSTLNRTPLN